MPFTGLPSTYVEHGRTLVRWVDQQTAPTRRPQECPGTRSRHPRLDRHLERRPPPLRVDKDCRRDPQQHRSILPTNLRRGTLALHRHGVRCRPSPNRPRLVTLLVIRRDALTTVVKPVPVPAVPDFTALVVGIREDLERYALRLLATHVLVAGATRPVRAR